MAAPIFRNAFTVIKTISNVDHVKCIHISSKLMRRKIIASKLTQRSNTMKKPLRNARHADKYNPATQSAIDDNYLHFLDDMMVPLKSAVQSDDFDFVEEKQTHMHRFKFEKMKSGDTEFGKVMTLVKSKHERDRTGKVLLEGKRLLTDAILAGLTIDTIYFCRHEALDDVPVESLQDTKFIKVPQKDVKLWTDVTTPQGVLGVCKKPDMEKLTLLQDKNSLPVTLICDNIREPGNMGALLRSAAAVNCQNVLVTKGCVDIWQPKVIRAGCGAHFRIPIQTNISWKSIHEHLDNQMPIHVADGNYTERERTDFERNNRKTNQQFMHKSNENLTEMLASVIPIISVEPYFVLDWTRPCGLVVGSESHGLSLEAIELCEEREGSKVFIPMSNGMNSLNSAHAASIVLYEARRQIID